ncbi:GIY-YIG nuclease family protein [Hymenobacter metallicola]|uniref:GIY-YIG domain-containing protein n=1 Tax=Hymenobacter metallicola TaxID=2563114 RepID=A0A4Z0QJ13_9BACT|nr:GIY-YIG nuclease family protein [Hymenobacter metallicola]TGE29764.1 hypothetical protein E5K02_09980 [Hymenobacter metallicola]
MEIRKMWPEIKGKVAAVYLIGNTLDDRVYIGSSCHVRNRMSFHFHCLKRDKHHSAKLQNFYNKYGEGVITTSILEICEVDNLIVREQYWIDSYVKHHKESDLMNIAHKAGSCRGIKQNPEVVKARCERAKANRLANHMAEVRESIDKQKRDETEILRRANSKCEICNKHIDLVSDDDFRDYHTIYNTNTDKYWRLATIDSQLLLCYHCHTNIVRQLRHTVKIANWLAKQP